MTNNSSKLTETEVEFILMRSASEESPLKELASTFSCWECDIEEVKEALRSLYKRGLINLYELEVTKVMQLPREELEIYLDDWSMATHANPVLYLTECGNKSWEKTVYATNEREHYLTFSESANGNRNQAY